MELIRERCGGFIRPSQRTSMTACMCRSGACNGGSPFLRPHNTTVFLFVFLLYIVRLGIGLLHVKPRVFAFLIQALLLRIVQYPVLRRLVNEIDLGLAKFAPLAVAAAL